MSRVSFSLISLLLLTAVVRSQENESKPDAYTGVAVGTGGAVGGSSISFDFRVTHYASDEEIASLAHLLKDQGQDALRAALEKLDAGRINPVGTVGNAIAIARRRRVGADSVITLVTARNMSFRELNRGGRTTDYPFGFVRVHLNEKGEGAGQIIVAAKIRFDQKKGHYELESYGNQYVKAVNVRPSK